MYEALLLAEEQVLVQLKPTLREHLELVSDTIATMGYFIDHISMPGTLTAPSSKSLLAAIALMFRLSHDLRCADLLVSRGYPKQALTMIISMYDTAYTLAFIGANEALAQEWLEYDESSRPFRDIHTLMTDTFSKVRPLGLQTSLATEFSEYDALGRFAKASPLLTSESAAENDVDEAVSTSVPAVGARTTRAARFALERGVWCAYVGMITLACEHAVAGRFENLNSQLHALRARLEQLKAI